MMLERLMKEWPFALGQGPFLISGRIYQVQKKAYAELLAGGHPELVALLQEHDETYAHFFDQTFLSTRHYDIFGIMAVTSVLSRALGRTQRDFIYEYSKRQMETDTQGFHRVVLRLVSPTKVFEKLVESDAHNFNFDPIRITHREAKALRMLRPGFPLLLTGWYDLVLAAYVDVTMARCGIKQHDLAIRAEPNGERLDGVELCDHHFEVRWT